MDNITVLRAALPLAKVWRADGSVSPYQDAKHFNVISGPVGDVRALSRVLTKLEHESHACVIRGTYKGDTPVDGVRRLRANFNDDQHHWVLMEVDEFEPVCADPVLQPEEAVREYVLSCLPPEWWEVTCHWQLSNSAGRVPGKLKVHLWFWLAEPATSAQLKAWAKANEVPVDRAVFNVVQVHYTAAPLMDPGVVNPVPRRSGLLEGLLGDEVYLKVPTAAPAAPVERGERASLPALSGALEHLVAYYNVTGLGREEWLHVGMALHHETGGSDEGLALWDEWSSRVPGYEGWEDVVGRWESFGQSGGVTGGTILKAARESGWVEEVSADEFEPLAVVSGWPPVNAAVFLPYLVRGRGQYMGRVDDELNAVVAALEQPRIIKGVMAYDPFTDNVLLVDAAGSRTPYDAAISAALRMRLEGHDGLDAGVPRFKPIAKGVFDDAVLAVSRRQELDSAKAWAESLVWDGVPRVASFYQDYMAVAPEDAEYAAALGLYMWTAMAGRAVCPGIKADTMPVWVDPEGGAGKSVLITKLVPFKEWATEVHLGMLERKEDEMCYQMRGRLVGEVAELKGLHSSQAEDIKAFLTRETDSVRVKYEKTSRDFPRRIFLIGTTNEEAFLSDDHGVRRFAPIKVGRGRGIDIDGVVAVLDQLWAEGLHLLKAAGGEPLWQGLRPYLDGAQHEFKLASADPWFDVVRDWLAGRPTEGVFEGEAPVDRHQVRTSVILRQALGIPDRAQDRRVQFRVTDILKQLGYRKKHTMTGKVWVLQT